MKLFRLYTLALSSNIHKEGFMNEYNRTNNIKKY